MADAGSRKNNPYIIGRPIDEPEMFFGRESLFNFLEDNLRQNVKSILLHGQRRIGKSSVLKQIPNFVAKDKFVFVHFDLQDKSQLPLSVILHSLATEIVEHLELNQDQVNPPSVAYLKTAPEIFSDKFLPKVYRDLGGKNLVLLLDEFDVLSDDNPDIVAKGLGFFPYLHSLTRKEEKLFIIPVVGRNLSDLPKLLDLFKRAPTQEIGLLDELSAKRLIINPVQGVLKYDEEAIQAILELSAGHPYFTQVICFTLFLQARHKNKFQVTRNDVEQVVEKAIENAEAGLAWFREGLPIPEQVVLSAVAEAQRRAIETDRRVPEEPLTLLQENYGVIQTEPLIAAATQLADKGFLDDTGRKVKVELVRRWLVQRYPLRQEIRELEKFEQEKVNDLCKVATKLRQQGKKQIALEIYQHVLEFNPNHFSTLFVLAKECLDAKDFDKAVELYTRAHQVEPIRYKEELLRLLEKYGDNLITQREWPRAKEQFNRVLKIDPDNVSAKQKLQEIVFYESGGWICEGYIDDPHSPVTVPRDQQRCPSCRRALNSSKYSSQYRRNRNLLGGMAAAAIIALVGVGVSRWSTPCSAGEQKVLGITCVADPSINISRGERTLFPIIRNANRDLGVEAFKQGKYSEAAEYFKKAVAANRNDPEVLIYYNNARAQQQGSPLTLAAVVPVGNATTDSAQEILRGVAQAQNEFNDSGGLNHRFLEIAIANDGNEQDKAKKVAQELVNDSSILGVIGHDSSEASRAGLAEYEKAGLAIISPTSTSTSLTSNVFFRTAPSDAAAGKKLAEYARKSLGLDKVVIFYNPDKIYSNSLQKAFKENFEQLGGRVVHMFDLGELNPNLTASEEVMQDVFGNQVRQSIFKYNAKAALLFPDKASTSVALAIVRANADLNTDLNSSKNVKQKELKLLGGDALYSKNTLNEGGKGVEGLILAVPWFGQAPQSKNFSKAAEKLWGGQVSWITATSFDATQAYIKALSNNPSRSTVLQRLRQVNLSSSETSGEALQFTPKGERKIEPILIQVVRGGLSHQGSAFDFDVVKPNR